jgi:hypothetical protein
MFDQRKSHKKRLSSETSNENRKQFDQINTLLLLANKTLTPKIQLKTSRKKNKKTTSRIHRRGRAKVIICQELKKNVFELFCCQLFVGGDCGSEVH